jgi:hypothetical protein
MVSVTATGPEFRGFKPGHGDEYLKAIKVLTHLSLEEK